MCVCVCVAYLEEYDDNDDDEEEEEEEEKVGERRKKTRRCIRRTCSPFVVLADVFLQFQGQDVSVGTITDRLAQYADPVPRTFVCHTRIFFMRRPDPALPLVANVQPGGVVVIVHGHA